MGKAFNEKVIFKRKIISNMWFLFIVWKDDQLSWWLSLSIPIYYFVFSSPTIHSTFSSRVRKESPQPHRGFPSPRFWGFARSFTQWSAAWLLFGSLFISLFDLPNQRRLVKVLLLALTRMGTWPQYMHRFLDWKLVRVLWTRTGSLSVYNSTTVFR